MHRYSPFVRTPFALPSSPPNPSPSPPHPWSTQAPPPPPTPVLATESRHLSGTGGADQPGDLLSSDLPRKEEAVTGGEGGVVDSSPSKGSGGQDLSVEVGEERASGGESEGGGEPVAQSIAQEEGLEGASASRRGVEGSRDTEGTPRESRGGRRQEAVGGVGNADGERGGEKGEQRVDPRPQGTPLSVEQPQQEGTGDGAAGTSTASTEEGQTLLSPSAKEADGERANFTDAGGNAPFRQGVEAVDGVSSMGGGVPLAAGESAGRRSRGEVGADGESGGYGTVPDSTDQEREEADMERVFGDDAQSAFKGGGVEGTVERDPTLEGIKRLEAAKTKEGEGSGGVHEDRPASTSLETHEDEPDLEDVASETTTTGARPATTAEKNRCSGVAAEGKGGEVDGPFLIKTSPTGEDGNGRRRDSEYDGLRGSPDAGSAGLEVTPPQVEGGAPDDERGEDAAPMLEGYPSEAGGGPGGGEGSDVAPGGAVSAAKVLDDGGVEEDVVFLQVRRRVLVVALRPCPEKQARLLGYVGFCVCYISQLGTIRVRLVW